jgi:hypothetical protein
MDKSKMMRWQIIILNILELAACLTGFLYWRKLKHSFWKWFPVYLAVIFLTEISAEYFLYARKDLSTNIDIYSYWGIPVQFFFFFWIFWKSYQGSDKKKWPLIAAIIYMGALVTDLFYVSKVKFFFESFSYTIGCLFILILVLIFFFGFTRSNEIINYRSSMLFWVSAGLLLFYIGTMPFFAFRKRLYVDHKDLFYLYWYVQFALNYLMYSFFISSFIWGKPK